MIICHVQLAFLLHIYYKYDFDLKQVTLLPDHKESLIVCMEFSSGLSGHRTGERRLTDTVILLKHVHKIVLGSHSN